MRTAHTMAARMVRTAHHTAYGKTNASHPARDAGSIKKQWIPAMRFAPAGMTGMLVRSIMVRPPCAPPKIMRSRAATGGRPYGTILSISSAKKRATRSVSNGQA